MLTAVAAAAVAAVITHTVAAVTRTLAAELFS